MYEIEIFNIRTKIYLYKVLNLKAIKYNSDLKISFNN